MRKVAYAKLQGSEAFLPGVGAFGTTLVAGKGDGRKTIKDLEIFEDGDKLLLRCKDDTGQVCEAFVPITNVQIARYAVEAPKKAAE